MGQRRNSESPWGVEPPTFGARNPKIWGSILHGDSEFFFVPRSWQDEKTSFLILHRAQNLPSLLFCQKHYAIDIADPSSMQDACYMNFVMWLSGRASERGIQRSEVRFLMGTQNFFFVPRSWQDEKTSFSNLILVENMKCRETFSRPLANFRNIVG